MAGVFLQTAFMRFWRLLNHELRAAGQAEALLGTADDLFRKYPCPSEAAKVLQGART